MVAEGRSRRGWNFDLPDGEARQSGCTMVWQMACGVSAGRGPKRREGAWEPTERGWLRGAGLPSQLPAASTPQ